MTCPIIALFLFSLCHLAGASEKTWMRELDNQQLISTITLPGTHDSGALKEPYPGTARTQSATITEQLNFGIRLLDIRCRHLRDSFAIYHGIADQDLTFAEVIKQVSTFLKENPSECVVMSIAETHKAKNNTRSFSNTLDSYLKKHPSLWHLKPSVPTLKEARGKIILLRRYHRPKPLGIDATQWPNNTSFSKNGLTVQDRYKDQKPRDKWKHITAAFKAAQKKPPSKTIHLNFTSGYLSGSLGIPNIPKVSNEINTRLKKHFQTTPKNFHGWIIIDFATADLTKMIFRCNFP